MKYKLTRTSDTPTAAAVDHIYKNLDPQQLEAVRAPTDPLLIIAGAGTGKTRTLMARCAHLIASGIAPDRILLCTFTLKAAREMRSRIHHLVGPIANDIWAGTFHHVGHRLLRKHATALKLSPDFSILDNADALDFWGMVLAEKKVSPPLTPAKCQAICSLAVNIQKSLAETVKLMFFELTAHVSTLEELSLAYQERKAAQHVVDFDDMLLLWRHLLDDPDCGEILRGMFDHVLVDEYQDTNPLQADIVEGMAKNHRHVTVVGDDAQSIYSFRGASLDTIQEFLKRFPDAQIKKLEQNYRSTQPILDLANASIAFSNNVIPRTLKAHRPGTQLPVHVRCADTIQEAQFIAQHLWTLHSENGIPLHELAVLTRTNSQSLQIQLEFSRRGIPFRIQGGLRMLEQAHFKDFIAYLRILSNPADEMAVMRIFRMLPGLGAATARQVVNVAQTLPPHTADAAEKHPFARRELWASMPKTQRQALLEFGQWLDGLRVYASDLPGLLDQILKRYMPILKTKYERFEERLDELKQLLAVATQYATIDELLADLGLQSGPAAEVFHSQEEPEDLAVLSTVHQAKGLEWQVVFVPSMCEGAFPLIFNKKDAAAMEEERRIFHVAVTRAKDELYLVTPLMTQASDQGRVFRRPSRFIHELPPKLYETWEIEVG